MEKQDWKIEFTWIKAHAGHHENELATKLRKGQQPTAILKATKGSPRIE